MAPSAGVIEVHEPDGLVFDEQSSLDISLPTRPWKIGYPSSHNQVFCPWKMGCISNSSFQIGSVIFHGSMIMGERVKLGTLGREEKGQVGNSWVVLNGWGVFHGLPGTILFVQISEKIVNFPASKAKNMKDDGISSGRWCMYIYIYWNYPLNQ